MMLEMMSIEEIKIENEYLKRDNKSLRKKLPDLINENIDLRVQNAALKVNDERNPVTIELYRKLMAQYIELRNILDQIIEV